ncbi:MAG TPA: hypothetical protein VFI92_13000 [Steroidobacteraceae bacterium]|nr:hypothetical protein [Steroidobacteraceae bacterium]
MNPLFDCVGRLALVLTAAAALAACQGKQEPLPQYSIGGTVSGLVGPVVLQNNGGDDLAVSSSGPFTFATTIERGDNFAVTVLSQPAGQVCNVTNGAGVASENVTDVLVTCTGVGALYTIGGTVTGLDGEVVLRNGTQQVTVTRSGSFTFATAVPSGTPYAVTVATQPADQTCTVANGSGTVDGANVTNIVVTCVDNLPPPPGSYSIGGTVSGLSGGTLRLGLEHPGSAGTSLDITSNGPFTFPDEVEAGDRYTVTVVSQPGGQTCSVKNGNGTASADVTDVEVTCKDDGGPPPSATYSIGGTVGGLSGGTLQLGLQYPGSPGTSLDITSDGSFTFPDEVGEGDSYTVTVLSQPDGQSCTVTNGSGTATADVTNVLVQCTTTAVRYTVGGTIEGLSGAGLTIEGDAANGVTPDPGATSFTLPVEYDDGAVYDVGVASQPADQTCVITRSHGAIAGEDVTNVTVTCIDNVTDPIEGTYSVLAGGSESVAYLTLFADGVYVYGSVQNDSGCSTLSGNGVEYGVYRYDDSTGNFAIRSAVVDTNGNCGVWDSTSRYDGTLTSSGGGRDRTFTLTVFGGGLLELVPVESKGGDIYGSFADAYHRNFWVFTAADGDDNGDALHFFNTQTQADEGATSQGYQAGVEYACGTIVEGSPSGGTLSTDLGAACQAPAPGTDGPVDTNGTSGLSHASGSWSFDIQGDELISPTFRGRRVEPN